MYNGVDKYGGGVVGDRSGSGVSVQEALQTASAEETLVVPVPVGDEGTTTVDVLVAAQLDVEDGGLAWAQVQDADRSYEAVVSMSQMTSMLRDKRRNDAYNAAIVAAVREWREAHPGQAPVVLDIGTGTGLLAMMAARAGAKYVVACEMFPRMATIATAVTRTYTDESGALNAFKEPLGKIRVLGKLSTDVTVGDEGITPAAAGGAGGGAGAGAGAGGADDKPDMMERADIVISEILDSALLGEGVLPSLRDAFTRLAKAGALAVPQSATVYGQVVDCKALASLRDTRTMEARPGVPLARRDWSPDCHGGTRGLPMHVSALSGSDGVTALTSVIELGKFDFTKPAPKARLTEQLLRGRAVKAGTAHAIVMWWDMVVGGGDVRYDTAASSVAGAQWQDHWVQVVHPLEAPFALSQDQDVDILACHTDVHMWFKAAPVQPATPPASASAPASTSASASAPAATTTSATEAATTAPATTAPATTATATTATPPPPPPTAATTPARKRQRKHKLNPDPPVCTCGVHTLCNHERIWMLNDSSRTAALRSAIDATLAAIKAAAGSDERVTCVDISDGSLCALLAASSPSMAPTDGVYSCEHLAGAQVLSAALVRGSKAALRCPLHVLSGASSADETPAGSVNVVVAEPFYFRMQNLPLWQCLNFWYKRNAMRVAGLLSAQSTTVPRLATIMAVPVEFSKLWINHGAVGTVQGFDHGTLDAVQAGWEEHLFAYPLWMYPFRALAEPAAVWSIDYCTAAPSPTDGAGMQSAAEVVVTKPGTVHAIMVWVDYMLTPSGPTLSTGPTNASGEGAAALPRYWKQCVRFAYPYKPVSVGDTVSITTTLMLASAKWSFDVTTKDKDKDKDRGKDAAAGAAGES